MQRSHPASHSRPGVAVISDPTGCVTIQTRDAGYGEAIAQRYASEVEEEAHRQVAFLCEESHRLGYADPDVLLSADPAAFVAVAAQWRVDNPRGHFGQQIGSPEFGA